MKLDLGKSTGVFVTSSTGGPRGAHTERCLSVLAQIPVRVRGALRPCTDPGAPRPGRRFEGHVEIGALGAGITLRSARGGGRGAPQVVHAAATLLPAGVRFDATSAPCFTLADEAPSRPRFADGRGHELYGAPTCAGEPDAGSVDHIVHVLGEVVTWFAITRLRGNAHPSLRVLGDLRLHDGVVLHLEHDDDGAARGPARAPSAVPIVPAERWVPIPEQEIHCESGPEPTVSVHLCDGAGGIISDEVPLGRIAALPRRVVGGGPRRGWWDALMHSGLES